jgi:hypothetical protein
MFPVRAATTVHQRSFSERGGVVLMLVIEVE